MPEQLTRAAARAAAPHAQLIRHPRHTLGGAVLELVDNMEEEQLNKLDTFATTLKKTLSAARKRRRESTDEDDE